MKLHYDLLKMFLAVMLMFICLVHVSAKSVEALGESMKISTGIMKHPGMIQKQNAATAGSITLSEYAFQDARGKVGEKLPVGTVHVTYTELSADMTIVPSGSVEGVFTTDVTTIPAGSGEMDVQIFYEAKKIGKDEGRLYFMIGEDILDEVRVKGLAIDPATPPAVQIEPTTFKTLKTTVGTPVKDTVQVTLVGLPSSVKVSIAQDQPGFTVNTTLLYYSVKTHNLVVTFSPKTAGEYEATLTLSNEFFEPVEIKVKGVASPKEDEKPEVEGDQLPLDKSNPFKLLNEGFDAGTHNKPLSLKGWKNLASVGSRAWWGYQFPDYDKENAGEYAAKVTAYDSKIEPGAEDFCQMILLTPPLDYKAAESKLFTFRVMGNNLYEGMGSTLYFCYFYEGEEPGSLMAEMIEGVEMPTSPDQNGEWIDYHVDLSNQNLDDVFFMGFIFSGVRGPGSPEVYYIDDVSFGRTDLPMMTPDQMEVVMEVEPSAWGKLSTVNVETMNLTEPIKLTLGGRDKAEFELKSKTVPAEGGSFTVKYKGTEGKYEAYVKLSSRGAATKYVSYFVTAQTGIQSLVTEEADRVEVYDAAGHLVRTASGVGVSATLNSLPGGTYVVRVTGESGSRTLKLAK